MWAKICGITTVTDIVTVVNAQADALGLNFYPGSKRFIRPDSAAVLADAARRAAQQQNTVCPDIVGLFVNSPLDHICEVVETVGLSAIQLHGDESTGFVSSVAGALPHVALIRALRISDSNVAQISAMAGELMEKVPQMTLLLDALVDGQYGGTGQMMSAAVLRELRGLNVSQRLVLAGGLTPGNLHRLFEEIQPWGVDTASGVESGPGIKDASLVTEFVQIAHGCDVQCSAAKGEIKTDRPVRLSGNR